MDNNTKEKTNQIMANIMTFFLLVAIVAFPIWLFTVFGSIIFSILVFSIEVVLIIGFVLGSSN